MIDHVNKTFNKSTTDRQKNLTSVACVALVYTKFCIKVCLNRYSWSAGKLGSEYSSWLRV